MQRALIKHATTLNNPNAVCLIFLNLSFFVVRKMSKTVFVGFIGRTRSKATVRLLQAGGPGKKYTATVMIFYLQEIKSS